MEKVIEISGLTKKYGDFIAVNNLSLTIKKGEIFGLLGPNGAGKSTTILMLLGLTEPVSGRIEVCGIDPVRYPIKVKQIVGYLPEDVGFYDDLSALENLLYTARLNRIPKETGKQKAIQLLDKVGLINEKDKKVGAYSRGMRQRLGFADVLIKQPEVIILDEPTLGIDPAGVREFLELIVMLSREKGITVLLSSHHLHQVQKVCDRVGIFVNGRLLAEGNIKSLAKALLQSNNFVIEGEVVPLNNKGIKNPEIKSLMDQIKEIKDISKVEINGLKFQIESENNIAPEISQLIVHSGYGLKYLNNKEFGLDDIYYQYFQGENNNSKQS